LSDSIAAAPVRMVMLTIFSTPQASITGSRASGDIESM
jgi:hypothetical protein